MLSAIRSINVLFATLALALLAVFANASQLLLTNSGNKQVSLALGDVKPAAGDPAWVDLLRI